MNDRNLAIKISKHPLLRKLTEDKTIPNSIVARLIVEELTEVQSDLLKSALGGVRRDKKDPESFLKKYFVNNKIVYPYGQLDKLSDEEKQKYVDAVNNYVKAFQMQQQEKLKDQGEKLEDQVDDAVDKELEVDQGGDVGDAIETLSTLLGVGAGIAGLFPGTAQLFGAPLSTASDVLQATDIVNDITAGNTKEATKKLLAIAAANYAASLLPGGITAKETVKQGSKAAAAQAAIRAGQSKVAQKVFNSGLPQYIASKFGKDVTEAGVQKAVEKLSQKAAGKAISGLGNELIDRSVKYQKEVEGNKDGFLEQGFKAIKGKASTVAKALGFGNPFEDLPGYKQLGLEGEEEEVFIAFLKYLQRKKIIKEGLGDLFDILGRGEGILTDFGRNEGEDKLKVFRSLLEKPEVLKFIKDNVATGPRSLAKKIADELKVKKVNIDWDQPNSMSLVLKNVDLGPEVEEKIQAAPEEKKKKLEDEIQDELGKEESGEIDMERLLQKFSNFIPRGLFKEEVINESIGDLIKILKPDDEKFFGQELGKRFQRQELSALRDHFEDKKNIAPFIEKHLQGKIENYDEVLAAAKKLLTEPESTDENPYSKLEGYEELNLNPDQETVFISFLNKLKEQKIIKEGNLRGLNKILGTESQKLADIIKSYEKPQMDILIELLKRDDVQAFIENNLAEITKPESGETEGSPTAGPQIPIQEENVDEFLKSTNEFLKEFYRKRYRKEQAVAIDAVLKSLGKMVEDENLAQAFQRVPDKKEEPETEEATTEEEPETEEKPEDTEQQEPEVVGEQEEQQEEEQKEASEDEMRNLRIGMNSLLKRVNYSKKALEQFQKTAGKGSVLAGADKKKFIQVLKEIQQAIKRICLVLQQIIRDTEKLNEEESEVIKEFREIQKKYDLASDAISNLAELLKPGGVKEIPKMLTNDAFSALVDLAVHFPSVAPFGAGKEDRTNFLEYDVKFKSAIQDVKDDLQNVFSLMKTGQAGEESLILALDGLKKFSGQIQAIFGVPSEFEELKVEPNEEAAEGEPEGDIDDMPRDLPTQLKDLLDEYEGRYKKVKAVLDDPRDLFKESIGDEFQQLKKAFLQSAGMLSLYLKNGRSILDSAGKKNMAKPEVIKSFRTAMEYFVSLYEELQEMYKKITDNPSVLEKIWRAITPKINKFKQHIKKIIDDILAPLDIDLDLQPGDIPGTEAPEVEAEEDFTEEISEAENSFKQFFSQEKFQELGGDPKYYDVFKKMVLIIYSKSQISEVNIGSINAPLTRSAPTGMFDQTVLQDKLKKLAQTNEALVREISEMLAAISTDKMKPLLEFVAQNKNNIVSLDFDAILSDTFMSAAAANKAKKAVKDIKTASNLNTLLSQKTSAVNRMVGLLEKETKSKAKAIKIKDALIIWYMMMNSSAPQSVKEAEEKSRYDKKNRFIKDVFAKIPAAYRMDRGKILKIKRNLRMYDVNLDTVISTAHYKISQTTLKKVYATLDEIFKGVKISTVMNKTGISKIKNGLVTKVTDDDLEKQKDDEEVVDDSLLDADDELEEKISRKIKPLIREMLNKGK